MCLDCFVLVRKLPKASLSPSTTTTEQKRPNTTTTRRGALRCDFVLLACMPTPFQFLLSQGPAERHNGGSNRGSGNGQAPSTRSFTPPLFRLAPNPILLPQANSWKGNGSGYDKSSNWGGHKQQGAKRLLVLLHFCTTSGPGQSVYFCRPHQGGGRDGGKGFGKQQKRW